MEGALTLSAGQSEAVAEDEGGELRVSWRGAGRDAPADGVRPIQRMASPAQQGGDEQQQQQQEEEDDDSWSQVLMLKRQQKQAEHQAHKFQLQLDKQQVLSWGGGGEEAEAWQVVLKRKMEEAAAANMRLKRLLEAKSSKGEKEEKEGNLEQWFEQEISFCVEVENLLFPFPPPPLFTYPRRSEGFATRSRSR